FPAVRSRTVACWPTRVPVAGQAHPCGWQDNGMLHWCIALFASTHHSVCGSRYRHRCGCEHCGRHEWLPCGAAIAVAFRKIGKTFGAVEGALLSVDTVPSAHIRSDVPLQ